MTQDIPPLGPPNQPPNARPTGTAFDPASVDRLDWALLGVGFIVFVFSFFNYYSWDFGRSYGLNLGSVSWSAWHFDHGLFIAWLAMVATVAGAVVLAISLFAPAIALPAPARVLTFLAFAVGFVLYLIAIFAHSDFARPAATASVSGSA